MGTLWTSAGKDALVYLYYSEPKNSSSHRSRKKEKIVGRENQMGPPSGGKREKQSGLRLGPVEEKKGVDCDSGRLGTRDGRN